MNPSKLDQRRRRLLQGIAAAGLAGLAGRGRAAAWPDHAIHLVVPFPPGGPTDAIGRMLGERMSAGLGQAVVIDNRPGAGGTVGASFVAHAAPDGYTLLYGSTSTLAISPTVYKDLAYDPARAFEPVGLVSRGAQILVSNPQVPAKTLRELVDYSKKNPEALTYASPGNGTPGHLGMELLKTQTGLIATHVPYKGGAPALTAVLAGQVQCMVDVVPTSLPLIRSGQLRALALLSPRRSTLLPQVPTVGEAGFADLDADFWSGLVAPAGTPAAIVDRLNAQMRRVAQDPAFRGQLEAIGAEPKETTPAEFATYIAGEMRKWAAVAKTANVKLDA